jgi:hypothetical protein
MNDIIDAKSALEDAIRKGIIDDLTEKTVKDLKLTLDLSDLHVDEVAGRACPRGVPHTVILLDDAINILKDIKHKKLMNVLFQNRQPRFTIFICVQGVFGLPVKIKRNCDAVWIFAGMTDRQAFGIMGRQLGIDDIDDVWQEYKQLGYRDVMIINYTSNGIELQLIEN